MMMKKLLAIDIGNTNITAGLFIGEDLIKTAKIRTSAYSVYEKAFKKLAALCGMDVKDVEAAVISSVVPIALSRLIMHLNMIMGARISVIGKDIKVPIPNRYRIKGEVGQDRLVNALAARSIYGAPCVIIDFGTAITFDIVSKKGEYLGGLILPGIDISLSALYEKTALLPRVELKPAPHIIGKDTAGSMRAGILFGFGAMCDGLTAKYKNILGKKTRIIATGGNASLIKKYSCSIDIVDSDLTLKGILIIAGKLYGR